MILLFLLVSLTWAQNPYGPSQLDQYARLLNSGNLGGFGWLNTALQQGTVRGFADLEGAPRLVGLPPLPLTHEEVMYQLTSTEAPSTTPATARPTAAPAMTVPPLQGIYAINPIPEMPPMAEERIHGTFDDDGVFHPDKPEVEEAEKSSVRRNQIQGTKIRDFSEPDRIEGAKVERSVGEKLESDYESDDFYDDPSLRIAGSRAQKREKVVVRTRPTVTVDQHSRGKTPFRRPQFDPSGRQVQVSASRNTIERRPKQPPPPPPPVVARPKYPPFVYVPKPAAPNREAVLTNLLSEIEEYDDFLDQRRTYTQRFPTVPVHNPYRILPEGQLPIITQRQVPQFDAPPRPRSVPSQPPPPQQPAQPSLPWNNPINRAPVSPQQPQQASPQQQAAPQYPPEATEHPILGIFNLFSFPHPHALAAPHLHIPKEEAGQQQPTNTGLFAVNQPTAQSSGLVDIQQHPLKLTNAAQNPLHLTPFLPFG